MQIFTNYLRYIGSKIRVTTNGDISAKDDKKKKNNEIKKREVRQKISHIPDTSPVIEIEKAVIMSFRDEMRQNMELRLQSAIESEEKKISSPECKNCKKKMGYKGKAEGSLKSLFGKITLYRRRYRCDKCGEEYYPADEKLGIKFGSWTPYAKSLLLLVCVLVPFEQAQKLSEYFWGIKASASGIWKLFKRVGIKIIKREKDITEVYNSPHNDDATGENKSGASVIQIGIDGAFVLCRGHKNSKEKVKDGDDTDSIDPVIPACGKEIKSAVIFKPQDKVEISSGRRILLRRIVTGILGNADLFFDHLWGKLKFQGLIDERTLVVVVADGAGWIWNRVTIFAKRIEILDFWHAAEHAWTCAKMLWENNPEKIKEWAGDIIKKLRDGKVEDVIKNLNQLRHNKRVYKFSKNAIRILENLINYYSENKHRMDYPYYKSQGYSIGSGSIESAQKQLIHGRMRGSGMRWSESGASCMVALRSRFINDTWNEVESYICAA